MPPLTPLPRTAAWLVAGLLWTSDSSGLELSHAPKQPRAGEPVRVTAQGAAAGERLSLQIQVVEPGSYIRKSDPAFTTQWQDFPMQPGGGAWSVTIPPEVQKHRRLIRYRLAGISEAGRTNWFPALTNASPNLAWFVYDGHSPWTGASRPGRTPARTFSPEFLSTLPAYHLLARGEDVRKSQWDESFYRRPLLGTFVFEGEVYDHIQFHNRGQASTYVAGKNKWGFKFNPGQAFAARNGRGELYRQRWASINMNPCASAWAPVNRGMAGMDEAVAYRAYQLAGVPGPDTFWVQFRVTTGENEAPSQHDGDLWGLYLIVQEKNGQWLRENGLPEGNIYSAESGPKHLIPGAAPGADLGEFRAACEARQSESWWKARLDLPSYYSFHALNRLTANIDLRPDGNYYLYHRPDGRWVVLPHDLDMMFIPKTHQPGYVPQRRCLEFPALRLAFQNRAREILDLLASDASPDGGQIGQLVAELAARIAPPGQERTWAELDEAIWNMHPRSRAKGSFYVTPCRDHRMGGRWERTLASPDFAGFCQYIVEFCTDSRPQKNYRPNDGDQRGYGFGHLLHEARDATIPARPVVRMTGWRGRRPALAVSPYAGSRPFAAVQWRAAEIAAPGLEGFTPGSPFRYEIEAAWTSPAITAESGEMVLPEKLCAEGRHYRARARYQDESGRWSHWSAPVQFAGR